MARLVQVAPSSLTRQWKTKPGNRKVLKPEDQGQRTGRWCSLVMFQPPVAGNTRILGHCGIPLSYKRRTMAEEKRFFFC